MKNKADFFKDLSIVIVVVLLGALLIASFFIPIMGASDHTSIPSYSCRDVVAAMRAQKTEDLFSDGVNEAFASISEHEGTAGLLIRIVGVIGMANAMIGAALVVCAIATLFIRSNFFRIAAFSFAVAAFVASITMITLLCVYLGIVTTSSLPYSYYYSIRSGAFVMMAASLCSGASAWFLDYFERGKEQIVA